MKKTKKIVFGLIGFFLALPALCLGATDWYDDVNTGVTFVSNSDIKYNELGFSGSQKFEYGAGYSFGLAFGNIMEPVRLEGEVSYRHNEFESVDGIFIPSGYFIETSQQNFMFNGYYDFNSGSSFKPYLTAGAGFSRVEADVNWVPINDEFDDTLFAYQIGAGVGYVIREIMTLDFSYRFLSAAYPEFSYPGGTVEAEIFSHKLTVGVHMAF
jgi:opacity protein-like surface antigen